MLDAFTRAIRKPPQAYGYVPDLSTGEMPPPGTRLRREPDGPVSMKIESDVNFHVPSPFRIGYKRNLNFHFRSMFFLSLEL